MKRGRTNAGSLEQLSSFLVGRFNSLIQFHRTDTFGLLEVHKNVPRKWYKEDETDFSAGCPKAMSEGTAWE